MARRCLGWLGAAENLPAHDLARVDLTLTNFEGTNLKGADLQNSNLLSATLEGVNLEGADLSDSNLWGAFLTTAVLNGADLKRADLFMATLDGASLKGADLGWSFLWRANFLGVRALDEALGLANVKDWEGAKIEIRWLERVELDATKLGLVVFDNLDSD